MAINRGMGSGFRMFDWTQIDPAEHLPDVTVENALHLRLKRVTVGRRGVRQERKKLFLEQLEVYEFALELQERSSSNGLISIR